MLGNQSKFRGLTINADTIHRTGNIRFINIDGICHAEYPIHLHNGLWYHHDEEIIEKEQQRMTKDVVKAILNKLSVEATYELWHQRLGHPGETIMNEIHQHVKGITKLQGNAFYRYLSCLLAKMGRFASSPPPQCPIATKPSSTTTTKRTLAKGDQLAVDFGFMRGEFTDKDQRGRIITSIDGYNSYAIIIDESTRWLWILLTKSKIPPVDFVRKIIKSFPQVNYQRKISTDQGGELARSEAFKSMLQEENYVLEHTGAYTPEQNGLAERPNRTLGQMTRCLLHSSGLDDKYWSYALTHAVYLKNRLPHRAIKKTPYEAFHGEKPDLSHLRCFGSKVFVRKHNRSRKLHMKGREGYFIGYTGTDKNIRYIDAKTRQEKTEKYALFDEAHFTSALSERIPPTATALRDAGYSMKIKAQDTTTTDIDDHVKIKILSNNARMPTKGSPDSAGWDIYCPTDYTIPARATQIIPTHLAIQCPPGTYARIAPRSGLTVSKNLTTLAGVIDADYRGNIGIILHNFGNEKVSIAKDNKIAQLIIEKINMAPLEETTKLTSTQCQHKGFGSTDKIQYIHDNNASITTFDTINSVLSTYTPTMVEMSTNPYENELHHHITLNGKHPTLGLQLEMCPQRNLPKLTQCQKGTPSAKLPKWRSTLRHSYITHINNKPITTIEEVRTTIKDLRKLKETQVDITFSTLQKLSLHSETGVPQLYFDQLQSITQHISDIKNNKETINKMSGLTRKKLQQQPDWPEWNTSEFYQLDCYHKQNMFSEPVTLPLGANCLPLLWTYVHKLTGEKKSRCVVNGSKKQSGTVTLGETYAGNVDQYSSKVFWAGTAIHNYICVGADISNAFAEAPPPVAPFYVYIDRVYREWRKHKGLPPIPAECNVLRVNRALQGHPESARLWEKHIDELLRKMGLTPSIHEPCLYSGYYKGQHVLFLRQVDDFAISAANPSTCNQLIDEINTHMKNKIHKLGTLTRFNGVDIEQTRQYVKISNKTYIDKIMKKKDFTELPPEKYPLPMNSNNEWQEKLEMAQPATTEELQALEEKYGYTYRQAIGEMIYILVTCRPDISYALIKLSQYSSAPSAVHFEATHHLLHYLHQTSNDGIYYWRKTPNLKLAYKEHQQPRDKNYKTAIHAHPNKASTFVDSDWGGDRKHRRSTSGYAIMVAGGTVLYKTKFQPTIALSSTEAEFTAACDAGSCSLYIRSLLNHIMVPQEEATPIYEDNNGAILMANAGKPTRRTRHVELKHFAIQDWVQKDLLIMKWISTHNNCSDSFTKALTKMLQYKHVDYLMGRVRPLYNLNVNNMIKNPSF